MAKENQGEYMIDIEKAKLEFDNYAKKYDMEDETINRKYYILHLFLFRIKTI